VILLSKKKSIKEPKSKLPEEETIMVLTPDVTIDHDDATFHIDVELPGVASRTK
jgi:HSP20 family molecular chaperone IbpA